MSENINENNNGYNENIISGNENVSAAGNGYEVEEIISDEAAEVKQPENIQTEDTRYDKYAAPSTGLNSNMLNGRKANFDPYTGEPLNTGSDTAATGSPASNTVVSSSAVSGAAYGETTVSGPESSSSAASYTVVSNSAASEAAESHQTIHRESVSGPAEPQFTYGSGAPTDVIQSSYTSSYGTIYRNSGSADTAKPKKHLPGWLKVIFGAAAFGVIAAAVFIGTNKLYDRMNSSFTPAVNEESASNKRNIINRADNSNTDTDTGSTENGTYTGSTVKKGNSDNTVASTQILTGNEVNYTDVSAVVEAAMPAIVQINCTFNTQSFFGTYKSTGAGSGIIIGQTDSELLIATNNHVVENALDVKVTFDDDSEAEAYVKGTDAYADLAVVAVSTSSLDKETINNIKVAVIGDSDSVKVGQMAIAIGNALGYGTSTTVGYISAKDREVDVDGKTMTLLQTDAAINPGNSGGALLNIKGEVIGINSVKYASSEVEGMGFAIPISRAVDILNELATRETLKDNEKGYLGVQMSTVTSDFANSYGWPTGVYVNAVVENSAAEKAGILVGDIITQINSVNVQTSTDLRNEITSYKAGTTVKITLQRLSRGRFKEVELEVTLGVNPDYAD
ncbi:MAG: trypsin-like peptidase domain-containing protein [Lachnospiraceae bacterium]|nr:trypsin-like peptidase domain-containing protein [Lachnospiraceae bacterium]